MGIEAPNYTQVPNCFFDYWMAQLSHAEFKVLMCVARKTFGWHKTSDGISLSQIVKMTGTSKQGAINAINIIISKGLIEKTRNASKEHGYEATGYRIIVHVPKEEDDEGQLSGHPSQVNRQGLVQPVDRGLVQPVDIQKKDFSKEKEPLREYSDTAAPVAAVAPDVPSLAKPKRKRSEKVIRAPHVKTTDLEHARLVCDFGSERVRQAYDHLSQWKEDTPASKWKKDDNRTLRRWVFKALDEDELRRKELEQRKERLANGGQVKKSNSNPCLSEEAKGQYDDAF